MIWLWILLALLVLFLMPAWLYVDYADETTYLRVGFCGIRVTVLPKRKKRRKKKNAMLPRTQKKRTIQSVYASAKRYFPLVKASMELIPDVMHQIVIDELKVYVTLSDDDPADLALHYGQAWAAIGWLVGCITNLFRLRRQDVRPIIDQKSENFSLQASVKVRVSLWRACWVGIRFLKRYLQYELTNNPNKGVQL